MLGGILRGLAGLVRAVLGGLTDGPLSITRDRALFRHSPALVFYQGADTNVIFSSFGSGGPLDDRVVYLQKRGWRTGLLGWSLGGYLAGAWSRGTDVTPQKALTWSEDDSLPEVRKRKLKREISPPAGLEYLETLVVHIPSSAPDGYYRLTICASPTHRPSIGSTSFRIYSSSLSTPSPRGANVYQLPAELVLGVLAGALGALLVAAFSVLFPFAKLASLLPGKWGKYLLRSVWGLVGGEDVERKVREHKTVKGATERVDRLDRSIAWSRIGVRRKRDAREDEGGGVALRP